MEQDEINVVVQRASELHAKINDAIERSLKSQFLLTRDGSSPAASNNNGEGSSPAADNAGIEEINAEAKSLGGIRDALETLEEQLECLQVLQHQQRAERDAALAELEQSRSILLKRLKNHRGKEWEIIQEALTFAGEPIEEREELPLPPYTMPLPDPSYSKDGNSSSSTAIVPIQKAYVKRSSRFFGIPLGFNIRDFAGRLFGPGVGMTSKAAILIASVITIVLFSEVGTRKEARRTSSSASHRMHSGRPQQAAAAAAAATTTAAAATPATAAAAETVPCPRPSSFEVKCPPGKVMIMQDGVPKCVVKERIEVPFRSGIKDSPDVLYGRG